MLYPTELQAHGPPANTYFILKPLVFSRLWGGGTSSTDSTLDIRGPLKRNLRRDSSAESCPLAATSTDPSGQLRVHPVRGRFVAAKRTKYRNPTPWTRPVIRQAFVSSFMRSVYKYGPSRATEVRVTSDK